VFVKSERATKTQDNNTIQSIGKISSALLILREVMVFLSDNYSVSWKEKFSG
jgi:hypothetical protein